MKYEWFAGDTVAIQFRFRRFERRPEAFDLYLDNHFFRRTLLRGADVSETKDPAGFYTATFKLPRGIRSSEAYVLKIRSRGLLNSGLFSDTLAESTEFPIGSLATKRKLDHQASLNAADNDKIPAHYVSSQQSPSSNGTAAITTPSTTATTTTSGGVVAVQGVPDQGVWSSEQRVKVASVMPSVQPTALAPIPPVVVGSGSVNGNGDASASATSPAAAAAASSSPSPTTSSAASTSSTTASTPVTAVQQQQTPAPAPAAGRPVFDLW